MYKLPETLSQDIKKFGDLAKGYAASTVSGTEFKAFRVPMGVYEQRKSEVYMARIRATGGVITPQQLLKVIDIAESNGSNLLHITTRAEVQILNLDLKNVQNVLTQLQEAGLATKGGGGNTIRNIIVSEFSGIDPDEAFDTTPYAMALTSEMVAEADSYLMPRKMKIAFASNPSVVDYAGINDIGLVAQVKDGQRGFKVYIGGGAGSKPTVGWLYKDFMPVDDLYALVKAMKKFFNANGNRKNKHKARIRYIFYRLGKEETFKLIDKYFDEELKAAHKLDVESYVTPKADSSRSTIVLPFKWGNVWLEDKEQLAVLRRLLSLLSEIGDDTLRFTTRQNIRLRNIPEERKAEVEALAREYDAEAFDQPAVLSNIVTCTGADTCRLGICLSKGLANAIFAALGKSGLNLSLLDDARINVTGCPNLCGQPLWSDLGFVGKVLHTDHAYPAYQIYVGADYVNEPKLAESVGTIAAYNVPRFVVDLVKRYIDVAGIAATLGSTLSFGAWLRSEAGKADAEAIARNYTDIPLFEDDKNPYFDWGSEEVFKVTQRGKPECSAGLFDMITVDNDSINDARGKDNYAVIFHAARMLLVTRGLDPQDAAGVFDAFKEHFIGAGYIANSFLPLIEQAKAEGSEGKYDAAQAEALADAVIALYKTMDDSLQFHGQPVEAAAEVPKAEEKKEAAPKAEAAPAAKAEPQSAGSAVKPTRSKDLRGVLCPMNFVRTKLELATLQSGDILEILLDDGKPIENVPGSVKLEGHEVISQKQEAEGHWTVLIRKK